MHKLRTQRSPNSFRSEYMQQSRAHNPFITVLYQKVRMSEIRDETFLVWLGLVWLKECARRIYILKEKWEEPENIKSYVQIVTVKDRIIWSPREHKPQFQFHFQVPGSQTRKTRPGENENEKQLISKVSKGEYLMNNRYLWSYLNWEDEYPKWNFK